MLSRLKSDFETHTDWLTQLDEDEAWTDVLSQMQEDFDEDATKAYAKHYERAMRHVKNKCGGLYICWEDHKKDLDAAVKELWVDKSLSDLKLQAIGIKMLVWLLDNYGTPEENIPKEGEAKPEMNEMQQELLPIFFNNITELNHFLHRIKNQKPTGITAIVNEFLKEEKINEASKNQALWEILHKYGYYKPSKSNWNSQVN